MWGREGGEGEAFLVPLHVCWVVCVQWIEKLSENRGLGCPLGIIAGGVPECAGKSNVDFLEAAVGDVGDGFEESGW